ncbi:hypothetical protein [Niveispirillum sp.]|uniref:hypothetical protein n=1 Tax=Niveispirillum sp. TaxID=1917217 RepID=UPI001B4DAAAE|nr:hypothetical protein [Niveispirillum sp.]MBP7339433.1 hypothetical protein [Niveispirillum sp.]
MSADTAPAADQPCQGGAVPYLQWHAMAERLNRKGVRQKLCETCGRWKFPQERCGRFKAASRRHLTALKREGAA